MIAVALGGLVTAGPAAGHFGADFEECALSSPSPPAIQTNETTLGSGDVGAYQTYRLVLSGASPIELDIIWTFVRSPTRLIADAAYWDDTNTHRSTAVVLLQDYEDESRVEVLGERHHEAGPDKSLHSAVTDCVTLILKNESGSTLNPAGTYLVVAQAGTSDAGDVTNIKFRLRANAAVAGLPAAKSSDHGTDVATWTEDDFSGTANAGVQIRPFESSKLGTADAHVMRDATGPAFTTQNRMFARLIGVGETGGLRWRTPTANIVASPGADCPHLVNWPANTYTPVVNHFVAAGSGSHEAVVEVIGTGCGTVPGLVMMDSITGIASDIDLTRISAEGFPPAP